MQWARLSSDCLTSSPSKHLRPGAQLHLCSHQLCSSGSCTTFFRRRCRFGSLLLGTVCHSKHCMIYQSLETAWAAAAGSCGNVRVCVCVCVLGECWVVWDSRLHGWGHICGWSHVCRRRPTRLRGTSPSPAPTLPPPSSSSPFGSPTSLWSPICFFPPHLPRARSRHPRWGTEVM